MAHSGHSGGPVLGPHGEIVAWVVWTVGPRAVGARADGLPLIPPVSVLVAGVDQLRPVDKRFEDALSEALDALLPATNGNPLRDRLATGGQTLPLTAGSAGHTAAAAQGAQATADRAQAAADGARATAESAQNAVRPVQQAMAYVLLQQMGATQQQLQRNQQNMVFYQHERNQLEQQRDDLSFQVRSLQLQFGEEAFPLLDSQSLQSPAMPELASNSSSRDSSPGRCSIEDLGLVIDGDYPEFDEQEFKRELVKLLNLELSWRDIEVTWAPGSRDTFARVQLGTCEVRVKCSITGDGTMDCAAEKRSVCAAEERRVKAFVRQAIEKHWPTGVTHTLTKPKVEWIGSIILVLELPQPLPVLLMQLARQASATLLEAVPGLLCCQLGDSVVRLEGCEDGSVEQLAAAMEDAKRLVVPSDEATRSEPSDRSKNRARNQSQEQPLAAPAPQAASCAANSSSPAEEQPPAF